MIIFQDIIPQSWLNLAGALKHKRFFHRWKKADSDLFIRIVQDQITTFESDDLIDRCFTLEASLLTDPFNIQTLTCLSLLKKNEDFNCGIDTKEKAIETFLNAERRCRRTNAYLDYVNRGTMLSPEQEKVREILFYASQIIGSYIGDVPEVSDLHLSFGPGASTTCKNKTNARYKLSSIPSVNIGNPIDLQSLIGLFPGWLHSLQKVSYSAAEISVVPKNYKTGRTICIEPSISMMVQRDVGRILKNRMRKVGLNLRNQDINKTKARLMSILDSDVTVDLKSASDLVCIMIVNLLLPVKWVEFLDNWRSQVYQHPLTNCSVPFEKFTSMGNGFNFELESMIFHALLYGISKTFDIKFDVSVYGDDIICSKALYSHVKIYFPLLGFEINLDKTFDEGPFRESCGGDYLRGVDVRPYFLSDRMTFSKLFSLMNLMKEKPHLYPEPLWNLCFSLIPENLILLGPSGYGDGHLHLSDEEWFQARTPFGRKYGYSGFAFSTHTAIPLQDKIEKAHRKPHTLPSGKVWRSSFDSPISFVDGDKVLPFYQAHMMGFQPTLLKHVDLRSYAKSLCVSDESITSSPYVYRGEAIRSRKTRIYTLT